jgi:hypothetical protein
VFTGIYRGRGWVALERELTALGIALSHCRPYHPPLTGQSLGGYEHKPELTDAR